MDLLFSIPIVIFIDTIGKNKANDLIINDYSYQTRILLRTEPLNYTQ
jgi:hypothetical protein